MSHSPALASAFNDSKLRSDKISPGGMCSLCTADCSGTCELGVAAVLGAAAVYPTNTGNNQIASEKNLPLDYSCFNINGRVFGAKGLEENKEPAIFNVKLERQIGTRNPVKLALPLILPALIKLNWPDYFAAAAMAGINCTIGEGSQSKDPQAKLDDKGRIIAFPKLKEMLDSFEKYYRGYGQIIVQCNTDDDAAGLPEIALASGAKAIEFKFGQSAKGTQPANRLKSYDEAVQKQKEGALVHPDPSDPDMIALHKKGLDPVFWMYGRLPMWDEAYLCARIEGLRKLGLQNVYFKMAGFDVKDIETVLRIASKAEVDLITFDGAGGGSGYSPDKMMNEWGLPALYIEKALIGICDRMKEEGLPIPAIALTGGFTSEDQVYKALAIGAPYITAIGLCRASMAAAMIGEKIGDALSKGELFAHFRKFGNTKEELFLELANLRGLYPDSADSIPTGALAAYSYLQKIAFGLQHFAALNRKFDIGLADQSDVIALTKEARDFI